MIQKQLIQTTSTMAQDLKQTVRMSLPDNDPVLKFTPTAWGKLLYLRDLADAEVGGFGICCAGDLLKVEDICLVKQSVSSVSVSFDDQAVADFFETQVDAGRKPEQFARIWVHTHPAHCHSPSGTDEETFARVFGRCQWAVMFIIAKDGTTYGRLRFNVGPGGQMLIPVRVDYRSEFTGSDQAVWKQEYESNVQREIFNPVFDKEDPLGFGGSGRRCNLPAQWREDLRLLDPLEREAILQELAIQPDLYDFDDQMFV